MWRLCFYLLLFFSSSSALAQQTLFNVPSSEETPRGEHFAQTQINFLPRQNFSSNFTYDYGLENFEVGLNVLDWSDLPKEEGGESTDFMANSQLFIDLSEKWHLGIGGQLGGSQEGEFAAYGFINLRWEFGKDNFVVVGVFDGNHAYLEDGNAFWHAGLEYALIEEKLDFVVDYINGSTSLSEGVVGFGYHATEKWMMSLGGQIPSPQSDNDYGVIFEITYKPE